MNDRSTEPTPQEFQPFRPLPPSRRALLDETPIPPSTRRRRRRHLPAWVGLLILLVFLVAIAGALLGGYEFYLRVRVVPGVRVLGEDVGGMTRDQAEARLEAKLGNPNALLAKFGGEQLVLRDGSRVFRAWPWELGFRADLNPALDAALEIGHRDDLELSLVEQARVLWLGADVSARDVFDEATARQYVSRLAAQLGRPARDASIQLVGLRVVEQPAQQGVQLDGEETLNRIRARLFDANEGEIAIAVQPIDPHVADTHVARAQVEGFLSAPLMLSFNDRAWAIDQATLAAMLSFQSVKNPDGSIRYTASLNHDALVKQVKALAREIDQTARDARFHFDNGNLTPTVTSQEGRTLDVEATVKQIERKFTAATAQARFPGNAMPPQDKPLTPIQALRENTIPLSVKIVKPAVDMRDASKMGIEELVAQGNSNFFHSIPGRIQNIKTATASFDGVVVPPGATFSFDKYLSDVVEANGYEDAYVIFNNRTVLGPGGGVCQVSTTAFRAAFWGGFPIAERWAHAYRVGYYEPPVGLDATVFAPDVDFKFVNDTGAYLLIETVFNQKDMALTFNFYGTKPNREVKLIGPDVTNVKPHAPAIYTDDPSLPKGTVKQVDFAVDGEDVTVFREIYVNGQMVKRDKFFSRYAPWQARYLRGTHE